MHTLPNQPIRSFRPAYQPVFPVSKNTNERERTRSSLAGLVCPSVSLFCPSLCPIVFFPFFCHFLPGLQLAYSTFIRVDCFTLLSLNSVRTTTPLGPHSDPSYCFSPNHPPSLCPPTHSISISTDRAGTGCAALDLHRQAAVESETKDERPTGTNPTPQKR